jgi:hypothetical protein
MADLHLPTTIPEQPTLSVENRLSVRSVPADAMAVIAGAIFLGSIIWILAAWHLLEWVGVL